VAFAPDGGMLASAGDDQAVRLWDPSTRRQIGSALQTPGKIRSIAFSPDGSLLAVAGADQTLSLWDPGTHRQIGQALPVDEGLHAVAISPDGTLLATAGTRRVTLWGLGLSPSQSLSGAA